MRMSTSMRVQKHRAQSRLLLDDAQEREITAWLVAVADDAGWQ